MNLAFAIAVVLGSGRVAETPQPAQHVQVEPAPVRLFVQVTRCEAPGKFTVGWQRMDLHLINSRSCYMPPNWQLMSPLCTTPQVLWIDYCDPDPRVFRQ